MKKQERAQVLMERLQKRYPAPESELNWTTPWELLVATVLSAQCTDERVNKVTPELFRRWPDAASLKNAPTNELEEVIHSAGFYRQKTKSLIGAATIVMDEFDGELPRNMEDMTKLPGVARKTANVVLSNAFGIQAGIAVDTHVKRLSNRLGLTKNSNVLKIEKDLMKLVPQPHWGDFNHMLVLYGRYVCTARKPQCEECELADICPKIGVTK